MWSEPADLSETSSELSDSERFNEDVLDNLRHLHRGRPYCELQLTSTVTVDGLGTYAYPTGWTQFKDPLDMCVDGQHIVIPEAGVYQIQVAGIWGAANGNNQARKASDGNFVSLLQAGSRIVRVKDTVSNLIRLVRTGDVLYYWWGPQHVLSVMRWLGAGESLFVEVASDAASSLVGSGGNTTWGGTAADPAIFSVLQLLGDPT